MQTSRILYCVGTKELGRHSVNWEMSPFGRHSITSQRAPCQIGVSLRFHTLQTSNLSEMFTFVSHYKWLHLCSSAGSPLVQQSGPSGVVLDQIVALVRYGRGKPPANYPGCEPSTLSQQRPSHATRSSVFSRIHLGAPAYPTVYSGQTHRLPSYIAEKKSQQSLSTHCECNPYHQHQKTEQLFPPQRLLKKTKTFAIITVQEHYTTSSYSPANTKWNCQCEADVFDWNLLQWTTGKNRRLV